MNVEPIKTVSMKIQDSQAVHESVQEPGAREQLKPFQKESDQAQLKKMVDQVQENLELIHNVGLRFKVHEDSGRIMVTVVDKDTGVVVREIPPKEILNMMAKFQEMVGMLYDRKA